MSDVMKETRKTGVEIAIIGMSGRFPAAGNIDEFWSNLINGRECLSFFSDEESDLSEMGRGLLKDPGFVKANGGVLENKEYFDASFFGLTPKEAEITDPQIRVFLECAWEALEDAAYDPFSYEGLIGVYAGATNNFFWQALSLLSGKSNELGAFAASALNDKDYLSAQTAYRLDLRGPAVTVKTACSTSLVAAHLACQALLDGECDIALVGGVSVSGRSNTGYIYKEGMTRSPDGHCRAFDANSNGTMGGNGAGAVILKSLENALIDRDHIYAVIKGTAINNDGIRKAGFSAPGREGQTEVIRVAQQVAEVEPESIGYIEAHGTGTAIGDPIEIEALKQAFAAEKKGFCAIGSVKTNIGHLDAAAGVVSLIKTVLVLKHKLIPPTLHYEAPNPKIDFEDSPFYVNASLRPWKSSGGPLRAAVSSLGIGGTNAHAVLEEWPGDYLPAAKHNEQTAKQEGESMASAMAERDYKLILLSAQSQHSLEMNTNNLTGYLTKNPHINLADAAFTLQVGRRAFRHRRMFLCRDKRQCIAMMTSLDPGKVNTFFSKAEKREVVFMFPGQGAQYVNMGLELYKKEAVFREEMDRCFRILEPIMGRDLKEILYPNQPDAKIPSPGGVAVGRGGSGDQPDDPESEIYQTAITQPLVFVLEYALAKLLIKWGIKPHAMIGHSIGEYVAACLSGVFTLQDALKLVVYRGRAMQALPRGLMLSVSLPADVLKPLLNGGLSTAAINAPSKCVVSGPLDAIKELSNMLTEKGIENRRLHTSHAFHSQMMEPMMASFEKIVKEVDLTKPGIPYISNVTGKWITAGEACDPGYWVRHLREAVRFSDGLKELLKKESNIFMEVGPGKTLSAFLRQHLDKKTGQFATNLVRHPKEKLNDDYYLLSKIGQLWLYGLDIDWAGFYAAEKRHRISLPPYSFDRSRYWIDGDPFKQGGRLFPDQNVIEKKKNIDDWFYISSWKRCALTSAAEKKAGKPAIDNCLVFIDDCRVGAQLVKRLRKEGKKIFIVRTGKAYSRPDQREFIVNPEEPGDYDSLIKDLKSTQGIPGLIVHLWSLTGEKEVNHIFKNKDNGKKTEDPDRENITRALNHGFYSQLYIARALRKQNSAGDFKILLVSNNIQEVTGEERLCPGKAAALGAVKVIPQECPNILCRSIDVDLPGRGTRQEKKLIDRLAAEVSAESTDTIVAYRNNHRLVQTFEPVRLDEKIESEHVLRKKGVYLITGGLGRIGLVLAGYLARSVQAKLVLLGRSAFPEKQDWETWVSTHDTGDRISLKIRKLEQIEKLGGQVTALAADVANPLQMKAAIVKAEETYGTINGVIYAAGVLDEESGYCPIDQISKNECEKQFRPKIYGLLELGKLLKGKKLDFCFLTSSLSAVLGGLGFIAYAAANNFMDAFVQAKNQTGSFRWISINWDGWRLNEDENRDALKEDDITDSILPAEGETTFRRVLSWQGENQVIVSIKDLQARIDRWVKLESIRENTEAGGQEASGLKNRPALVTPYTAPREGLEQAIAAIWQKQFGFDDLGIYDDFFELGGDSLKMMTVVSKIHRELEVDVPLVEFFNHPTIAGVTEFIKNSTAKQHKPAAVEVAEKKEYYPLSSAQKRLYILQELDKNNTGYNMGHVFFLEGKIDKQELEQTLLKLIKRHGILHSSIQLVKDEPVQVIHQDIEFKVEHYESTETAGREIILKQGIRAFDLSSAPFFRVILIKVGEKKHIFFVDMHHIITDGVSFFIFMNDFILLYGGRDLPSLEFQYKDYSELQNSKKERENIKLREEYWLKKFEGQIPVLDIPADFPRPVTRSYKGGVVPFKLEKDLSRKVDELVKQTGTTRYMVLLSIYIILLFKYTQQEDIVVGSPIPGRSREDLQKIMGMFVNMLAMRNRPDGRKSYREFLAEVKETALKAFENQDYQFYELVKTLGLQGHLNKNPLFDTVFEMLFEGDVDRSYLNSQDSSLKVKPYDLKYKESVFDLILSAFEDGEIIMMKLTYSTALFSRDRIEKMSKHYTEILVQVVANMDVKLHDIGISHSLISVKSNIDQDEQDDFAF